MSILIEHKDVEHCLKLFKLQTGLTLFTMIPLISNGISVVEKISKWGNEIQISYMPNTRWVQERMMKNTTSCILQV